jgi:hypothetical protein
MSKDAQSSERKARDVGVFVPDAQCKLHFFHAGWAKEGSERIECVHRFGFESRRAMAVSIGLSEAQLKGVRLHMLCDSPAAFVKGGSGSVDV